ncbi:hypothetical protein CPB84DRAFT_1842347 [Gymnopilus junonius]|uniref:Uncharacterized protein n=1 Tax=Gymnopilus junonius TaxID=109634 RepID=A0A9P5NZ29_GYMJU|nr:hypothetical protein CPB84DRAFT_1842347 [Gymnopilus junonius]
MRCKMKESSEHKSASATPDGPAEEEIVVARKLKMKPKASSPSSTPDEEEIIVAGKQKAKARAKASMSTKGGKVKKARFAEPLFQELMESKDPSYASEDGAFPSRRSAPVDEESDTASSDGDEEDDAQPTITAVKQHHTLKLVDADDHSATGDSLPSTKCQHCAIPSGSRVDNREVSTGESTPPNQWGSDKAGTNESTPKPRHVDAVLGSGPSLNPVDPPPQNATVPSFAPAHPGLPLWQGYPQQTWLPPPDRGQQPASNMSAGSNERQSTAESSHAPSLPPQQLWYPLPDHPSHHIPTQIVAHHPGNAPYPNGYWPLQPPYYNGYYNHFTVNPQSHWMQGQYGNPGMSHDGGQSGGQTNMAEDDGGRK